MTQEQEQEQEQEQGQGQEQEQEQEQEQGQGQEQSTIMSKQQQEAIARSWAEHKQAARAETRSNENDSAQTSMNAQCAFRPRALPGLTRPNGAPARDILTFSEIWPVLRRTSNRGP